MAILLSFSPYPPNPSPVFPRTPSLLTPNPNSTVSATITTTASRRHSILKITSLFVISFAPLQFSLAARSSDQAPDPAKPSLSGIVNTKSWFQFFGDGFAIRVPPQFEDIMEPEDFNAGLSLYGDKAKPKTFAARFASPDGSEVLSVIIRPTNQLKITFLEAKDVTDLGSLKEAARIFVPGGATLYSARTLKIKEEEGYRTYYFYEFGRDDQHVALVAAVNGGKIILGFFIPCSCNIEDTQILSTITGANCDQEIHDNHTAFSSVNVMSAAGAYVAS